MDLHGDPYGPYQLEVPVIVRAGREKAVVAAASPLNPGSQKKNLGRRQLSPQQQNRRRLMEMDADDSITTAANPEQEESAPLDLTPDLVTENAPTTKKPALVYALGTLGFDFGTAARRDGIMQAMNVSAPPDAKALMAFLADNPEFQTLLVWTLGIDGIPFYAIKPAGPFALRGYEHLRTIVLAQQADPPVERMAVPGHLSGTMRLMNGMTVPVIATKGQGITSWTTQALHEAMASTNRPENGTVPQELYQNFLDRVYYELRNAGVTPEERAINFAATKAFQLDDIMIQAARENLVLDSITVEAGGLCRPGSECRDVVLSFFNPQRRQNTARQVFRLTVDVSEALPVMIGPVHSWYIY